MPFLLKFKAPFFHIYEGSTLPYSKRFQVQIPWLLCAEPACPPACVLRVLTFMFSITFKFFLWQEYENIEVTLFFCFHPKLGNHFSLTLRCIIIVFLTVFVHFFSASPTNIRIFYMHIILALIGYPFWNPVNSGFSILDLRPPMETLLSVIDFALVISRLIEGSRSVRFPKYGAILTNWSRTTGPRNLSAVITSECRLSISSVMAFPSLRKTSLETRWADGEPW